MSRGEAAFFFFFYAVIRQQLENLRRIPTITSALNRSSLLPVAPTFFPPLLYSAPLNLLPDYFGSDAQNGGCRSRELEGRVETIF